ncbi:MAG: hypothetical protein IBX64_09525 [Actinobacteria bacterium]|nr:hypothetical protein [Actinomycetota bacterium]
MGWISRLLGYVTKEEREGISLGNSPAWEVSPPREPETFVRALHLLLPSDAVIYLEDTSNSKDIQEFLKPRQISNPLKVALGTIWPRPQCFHIQATPNNLEGLARLFSNHSPAEICIHFHAYNQAGIILEWHDIFSDDPLYISKAIPEQKIKSFSSSIGSSYKPRDSATYA